MYTEWAKLGEPIQIFEYCGPHELIDLEKKVMCMFLCVLCALCVKVKQMGPFIVAIITPYLSVLTHDQQTTQLVDWWNVDLDLF